MYRKVLAAGVTAAAVLGAGGTALAMSGSDTSGTGSLAAASHSTAAPGAKAKAAKGKAGKGKAGKGRQRLLRRLSHAEIVTKGPKGFVTHDLIKGSVTAVSATSITVQAADKTSETFVVDQATKVRVRTNGKGAAGTIAQVANGDQVFVAGTGTSTKTAKHVVDVKKK